jgi:hypothetical protein
MSNQRSVMTEFRFLDQKRQAEGLTAEEAVRYAQLRDLVGPETAGPTRSGFDVNAAAARLRESLLPAGLRSRPPEADAPPPEAPPEIATPPEAAALEQAWADAPFSALTPEAADPLFDPGSLAQEIRPQAWNPEAPGYDPDAPYDEAAWIAAGYDPTATYDWSAAGYGPDGQPLVEGAPATGEGQPLDEDAPPPEPASAAEEPVEGDATPGAWVDPGAAAEAPWDGAAAVLLEAPGVEQAWGAPILEAEPALEPVTDPAAAEPAWEAPAEPQPAEWTGPAEQPPVELGLLEEPALALGPEEELPFDPNAPFDHAKWFGRAGSTSPALAEPEPAPAQAPLPEQLPEVTFDPAAEPADPLAAAFGEYDESAVPSPDLAPLEGADLVATEPLPPAPDPGDPLPAVEASPDTETAAGWLDGAGGATHQPAPADAPFGEYDEVATAAAGDALAATLPFDPAAASAIEQGDMPEGYEPGGPALDPAELPALEAGGYDDPSAFPADQLYGGPDGDVLPGGAPLDLDAAVPDWQPETALEQGFELASDGSFGHAEPPPVQTTPAWGAAAPAAPGDGWESAPALDLTGPFDAPTLTPSQAMEPWSPSATPLVEELPTIDGAELLEELPVESASPLDLAEAAGASPLDGAFDQAEAVEAAAYPPPDLAEAFAPAEPDAAMAEPAPLEPEADPEAVPAWAQPLPEVDPSAEAALEPAALQPESHTWEPEPAISYEASPTDAGGAALPPEIAAAYGDLPSSDTFELPPAVTDGLFDAAPGPEPEPMEAEPLPPPAPSVTIQGSHRVVLHTVDGQVKRGLLVDALLDAQELPLQPQGPGVPEAISTDFIKAIFFMLAPGEKAPVPEGKKVRVTFRDGRQVAGFSPDYQDGTVGFFMIPADTRTNTGRIWVYQAAVKQVTVS